MFDWAGVVFGEYSTKSSSLSVVMLNTVICSVHIYRLRKFHKFSLKVLKKRKCDMKFLFCV